MRTQAIDVKENFDGGRFVASTYNYFFVSLIAMTFFGYIGLNFLPKSSFLPIAFTDCILWVLCGWFGWRNPISFVFPVFIAVTGLTLGLTALYFAENDSTGIFVYAAVLTLSVFCILTIYVHVTKKNFDGLIGFLIAGFWILLIGFAIDELIDISYLYLGLVIFGTLVFCSWILYDTSRILRQPNPDLTPSVAAFELFLDVVGLFSYVLDWFGISKD